MGQYFLAVNTDKREYVCPWCVGGTAKLWEWAVNTQAGLLVLLLRQSSEGGGGDYDGSNPVVGSWAGERVALVGDYDKSGLYNTARRQYRNISRQIGQAFNSFTEIKDSKLALRTCDSCTVRKTAAANH